MNKQNPTKGKKLTRTQFCLNCGDKYYIHMWGKLDRHGVDKPFCCDNPTLNKKNVGRSAKNRSKIIGNKAYYDYLNSK